MAVTYGYDKNTDYKKLMDEAVKAGDYARAAIYEQQRNEKIAGEGLTQYGATNQYSTYLPGSQKFDNPYKYNDAKEAFTDAINKLKEILPQ